MDLTIIIPAYNCQAELDNSLRNLEYNKDTHIIVVDDASTDDTINTVLGASSSVNVDVTCLNSVRNSGHGPSTLRGLRTACTYGLPVIAIDGDGQFYGDDIKRAIIEFERERPDVLEGVRLSRDEPIFRRLTSGITRLLVFMRTSTWPKDANTPFRIYSSETLKTLLKDLDSEVLIPNLVISARSRNMLFSILEFPMKFRPRLGAQSVGTMWGTSRKNLPSKRFVLFCFNATRQWLRLK